MAELFLGGKVDPATHDRTGDDVRIDADDLTTHGVIVGMTGSGKTGLGIVLIEEVPGGRRAGAADRPQGRPHQPVPARSPTWRRPTSGRGSTRRQAEGGRSAPDDFAAQQADGVEGRAWPAGAIGPERIAALRGGGRLHDLHARLARPACRSNIVGSLQAPADTSDVEVVGDEIEGYVSGLLGLVGIERRSAVVAASTSCSPT